LAVREVMDDLADRPVSVRGVKLVVRLTPCYTAGCLTLMPPLPVREFPE
jgi:hypothetical protein